MTGPDVLPCRWCLITPPRHDRCLNIVFNPNQRKTGTRLNSVGATVPVYDAPLWVPCPCDCRTPQPEQEALW